VAPEGQIPQSVKYSFYIGAAAFFIAVMWTVFSTKEYSPEQLASFEAAKSEEDRLKQHERDQLLPAERFLKSAPLWIMIGLLMTMVVFLMKLEGELYILTGGLTIFGLIQLVTGRLIGSGNTTNGFVVVINDLFRMPKTMGQLAVVQFFSWFALFAMWIYTTAAVTSHIYGTSDTTSELYNTGADWVGIMFAVYNGFAAMVAFLLPVVARWTNRRITHAIALIAGGIGLISIYFVKDPNLLIVSMLGVGLAWSSILSMPYAILTGSSSCAQNGNLYGYFQLLYCDTTNSCCKYSGILCDHHFGRTSHLGAGAGRHFHVYCGHYGDVC
jgi:maltose/moltooligosaccharide transporter